MEFRPVPSAMKPSSDINYGALRWAPAHHNPAVTSFKPHYSPKCNLRSNFQWAGSHAKQWIWLDPSSESVNIFQTCWQRFTGSVILSKHKSQAQSEVMLPSNY